MEKVADFRIQILKDDSNYMLTLQCDGDEFEIEVDNPHDLEDEVSELIQEKLAAFGVKTQRS
jgi:hypothetical protein